MPTTYWLKFGNAPLGRNGSALTVNGHEALPAKTLRLLYPDGVTPTFTKGTGTQVSSSPNVWDLHYDNTDWSNLLRGHALRKVLGAGDTSGVLNMSGMFDRSGLREVCLFDTSACTNMWAMFRECTRLTTVPLFDTRACRYMGYMFDGCTGLTSVPPFNASACTDMSFMFQGCTSLTTVPLFDTSACISMWSMFVLCTGLATVPLFDTSACTNMASMFGSCTSLAAIPLFDTGSCVSMSGMFTGCTNVGGGALALYQQASTQAVPPDYHDQCFYNCGINTATGAAELAQIPSDWK